MNDIITWQESGILTRIYYFLVLLAFVYITIKHRKYGFSVLIILLFFNGLFSFYGKSMQNAYRIILVIITLYWLIRTNPITFANFNTIIISFLIFSITFLYTSFFNDDYFFIIFSQYSRYFILFTLFFILSKYVYDVNFRKWLELLVYDLLLIQIFLSLIKYLLIGPAESIVGSVASQGGANATVLPILGFIFLWLKNRGKFESRDWMFTIGLAFIGFVCLKRAIWFIMPILMALMLFYVPKHKIPLKVAILSLFVVPLVFYMGIRFNPTLNREGRIGGSFDINYAINYAQKYTFGSEDINETGQGRGGATILVYNKFLNGEFSNQDWLGHGLRFMYATDYAQFDDLNLGINSKGAATGLFQTLITNGYIGIFSILFFAFSLLVKTKFKRLRYVLFGIFIWEYFFYTGIILRELSLSFLLIYIILFSEFTKILPHNKKQVEIVKA
jgi:hypothetical protein